MQQPKRQQLTDLQAAILTHELETQGEVELAKTIGVARQTLSRAANKRKLYSRPREEIQAYLESVSLLRAS
jgi:hypothetical protein